MGTIKRYIFLCTCISRVPNEHISDVNIAMRCKKRKELWYLSIPNSPKCGKSGLGPFKIRILLYWKRIFFLFLFLFLFSYFFVFVKLYKVNKKISMVIDRPVGGRGATVTLSPPSSYVTPELCYYSWNYWIWKWKRLCWV